MFSVRRGVAWLAAAQGSLTVLQIVVSIQIARLLGPYEMGIFAVAFSVVGLLSIIRSVGLGSYIIRAAEVTQTMLATAFTINAVLGVIVALAIMSLGLVGSAVLEEPGVRRLLLLMAILPVISIFEFVPATMIERKGDFRLVAAVNIARFGIGNLVTLSFAYAGHGYMSLGYGQLVSALIAAVMNNVLGHRWVRVRFGLQG